MEGLQSLLFREVSLFDLSCGTMKDPICKPIFIVPDLELAQYKKQKTFSLEDSVKINYKQCLTTGANNRLIKKFKKMTCSQGLQKF